MLVSKALSIGEFFGQAGHDSPLKEALHALTKEVKRLQKELDHARDTRKADVSEDTDEPVKHAIH